MTASEMDFYIEHWRDAAACRDTEVDFFPDPADLGAIAAATEICAACVVADECLAYALETNQTEGVWGGFTPTQRRSIRRSWLEIRRAS